VFKTLLVSVGAFETHRGKFGMQNGHTNSNVKVLSSIVSEVGYNDAGLGVGDSLSPSKVAVDFHRLDLTRSVIAAGDGRKANRPIVVVHARITYDTHAAPSPMRGA
jgi:hypothetical protein